MLMKERERVEPPARGVVPSCEEQHLSQQNREEESINIQLRCVCLYLCVCVTNACCLFCVPTETCVNGIYSLAVDNNSD